MPDLIDLQRRIQELETENARLKAEQIKTSAGNSVTVPPELKPLFDVAQNTVNEYFQHLRMDPAKGTIEINDERFILVRASALSKDFLDTIRKLYPDKNEQEAFAIGKNFLFDIAHVIGMNDARSFHTKMNLTDPIAKLSAGPVLFAHTGWAFVDISPDSIPTPDENYYLLYNHPYSFEADSWVRSGKVSDTPICIMNSGYSSGWCEESFGIQLTAVEVSCTARGDKHCTFIMSPPHRIQEHLDRFHAGQDNSLQKKEPYEIPAFFDRKRVEEEIHKSKLLAEESARSKSDFAANISHELRTPLSTILGFSDLLKKTGLDDRQKEYMEAISTSGKSLLSIINNILDLSKIDAGKLIVENIPFTIPELLQSLQVIFSREAKAKGLKFNLLIDPSLGFMVSGDPTRLTQILINLTGNAIKFTETGKVELSASLEDEDENYADVGFTVRDTGIGISPDKIGTIFERFVQADSNTTRKYGGTGLGLSITRQLVELLNGDIEVTSEPAKGTEFHFTLRFQKSLSANIHTGTPGTSTLPQYRSAKKILIVEDTVLNQKLTSIILGNNGFQTRIADNGISAVEILKNENFDLILMDIQMPEMDGYEATCIIRDELNVKTPIIAMTAHALAGEKELCFQQGVNDYLAKPFTEADLLFKISGWITEDNGNPHAIVDLAFLKKQTRNNMSAIIELSRDFVQENPGAMEKMIQAINRSDYQSIYKSAHALKTETSMFGLKSLVSLDLNSIEELARQNKDLEEIKKHFHRVQSVCRQAVSELETLIHRRDKEQSDEPLADL